MKKLLIFSILVLLFGAISPETHLRKPTHRYLYVATPGIRNYLDYGGHGVVVFDIDKGHKVVKRIPMAGLGSDGKPLNVKGVCASLATGCLYVSTLTTLQCLDLKTEKLRWEKSYEGGCDRMSLTPDGKTMYLPSLEKDHWHVVDAATGDVLRKITPNSGAHNTICGADGKEAYLAGLRSPYLTVVNVADGATRLVGPFSAPIRPFTVNGKQSLVFVNVNGLLGFEVGDLKTGKMLHRVEVTGVQPGPVKRHGCPSHGVGLTPDERELWLADGANQMMHVFDATVLPPRQVASLAVRDQPGWVTFSLDGRYAYPSTGEVFDVKTRKIVAKLEEGNLAVHSEKLVEIHFEGDKAVRVGDQFGVGRVQ